MRSPRLPHVSGRSVSGAEEQCVNRRLTLPAGCHSVGGNPPPWDTGLSRGDVAGVRTLNHQTTACVRCDDQEG